MKASLGRKIGTYVLVLMLALCCLPLVAGAFASGEGRPGKGFDRPGHGRLALGIWRSPQVIEKLQLSNEQVKQLRDLDFATSEKVLPLKSQIEAVHLKMDRTITDDNVDRKLVLRLAKKTADLKGKIFVRHIEARLAFKAILTTDQLNELKHFFIQQKKRGPWYGQNCVPGGYKIEKRGPQDSAAF